MKEHIDTMPIWEAYRLDCECPLCEIHLKNEAIYVDSYLGASVMEPDTRIEVNKRGFCHKHNEMMFNAGNRLSLALITHTYMKDTMALVEAAASNPPQKGGLFKKPAPPSDERAKAAIASCTICERLDYTMSRYIYTMLCMYNDEQAFRDAFAASKGLCLPHYFQVMEMAPKHLHGKRLAEFQETLVRIERENLKRVEGELEWFTQKFDYRNQSKPWGNSQDAVERSINKLRGKCIGEPMLIKPEN